MTPLTKRPDPTTSVSPAHLERVTIRPSYRTEHAARVQGCGRAYGPSRSTSLHTEAAGAWHPEAFGPFRVLHQIGAGALGPVFRAYDPDEDRLVAVKLFQLDLPPERVLELVAQLQTLIDADLTHPAVAAPIATGVADGGTAYLALDFVAADSPDVFARELGPARAAQTVRLVAQLAGALDFAADANIVHGALHPRDVLVSAGDARVTGIGITQVLDRAGVATPVRRPYTAPERAAGAAWDRRADVFSLAAIVHELLWGRRIAATGQRAAAALIPLEGADLDALRRLFGLALADNPADRFDSATEFSAGLQRALTIEAEPRLPLDVDTGGDPPRSELDVALMLSPPEETLIADPPVGGGPVSSPIEDVEATLSDGDTIPAAAPDLRLHHPDADERAEESETAIVDTSAVTASPSLLAASAAALDRTRSAVWPLTMALGVGLAVGFALGYSLAGREEDSVALQASAPSSGTQNGVPDRGVSETEIRLKPLESDPAPSPPPPAAAAPGTPAPETLSPATSAEARAKSEPSAPALATGRLTIRSTPPGANAFLDGRAIGRTPVTEREVAPGSYLVRVTREGFVAQERRISVSAKRPSQSVSFDLVRARPAPSPPPAIGRASGAVSIESRPEGATVILDGKVVGTTPITLGQVADGTHSISLELTGFRRWNTSVKVVAGERQRVAASLER